MLTYTRNTINTINALRNRGLGYDDMNELVEVPAYQVHTKFAADVRRIRELRASGMQYHEIDEQLFGTDGTREQSTSYHILRTAAAKKVS